MSETAFDNALSRSVLAVIGTDLFGIPERYELLFPRVHAAGASMIRDAAQGLFSPHSSALADAVIQSFGRGKPVSVLQGGVALVKDEVLASGLSVIHANAAGKRDSSLFYSLKILSYNLLRDPRFYWLPASLPFLNLGATHYVPLSGIGRMSETAMARLPANLGVGRGGPSLAQRLLHRAAKAWSPELVDLAAASDAQSCALSRFPLLARTKALKEHLLELLAPFGVSAMYPGSIADIPGVYGASTREKLLESLPNANSTAERILTLPVHEWMVPQVVTAIDEVLGQQRQTDIVETYG